jgi:hypothetical protein
MQGPEDRQRGGKTQVAQGYDLVEAAALRNFGLRSPRGNQEKQDAGGAHRNHRTRHHEKSDQDCYVHVNALS